MLLFLMTAMQALLTRLLVPAFATESNHTSPPGPPFRLIRGKEYFTSSAQGWLHIGPAHTDPTPSMRRFSAASACCAARTALSNSAWALRRHVWIWLRLSAWHALSPFAL